MAISLSEQERAAVVLVRAHSLVKLAEAYVEEQSVSNFNKLARRSESINEMLDIGEVMF